MIDMEPVLALEDFRKRVANYEKAYEPIGEEEETENIQYCKVAPPLHGKLISDDQCRKETRGVQYPGIHRWSGHFLPSQL